MSDKLAGAGEVRRCRHECKCDTFGHDICKCALCGTEYPNPYRTKKPAEDSASAATREQNEQRARNLLREMALPENEGRVKLIADAFEVWGFGARPAVPLGDKVLCAAQHSDTGANDPQECDWPFCGCDPKADKVIEAIEESGFKIVRVESASDLAH